jgi:outer membrane protein assembly factor BamB
MIVLNAGKVIAFDRKGKVLWTSKRTGHAYSTPALFEHKGKPRLAVFNGSGLVILDQKDGDKLAHSEWKTRYDVNAATPVVIGDKIFISSGYGKGCSMLQFDGKGLKTLWANREMKNHMSGCVYHDGHLYGFDETILKCLDLEGEVKWSNRRLGKGALVMASGKLLLLTRNGDLVVAEATPEEYRELSRSRVLERGGVHWTTPVLCGGLVYCRSSSGQLVCVDRRPVAK